MKNNLFDIVGILLLILIGGIFFLNRQSTSTLERSEKLVLDNYGNLPLSFEINEGQTDNQVKFLARGRGYTIFLTPEEAVLAISGISGDKEESTLRASLISLDFEDADESQEIENVVVRMSLVGANPVPEIIGLDELPGKSNYFIGNDPEQWHTDIFNYTKVLYRGVYSGVDMVYYGNQGQLQYDLVVSPGADYKVILLAFEGVDKLDVDDQGDLILHIAGGQIRQHKPIIYQEMNGVRQKISGGYLLSDNGHVGFQVAAYDTSRPLIIDPVLSYSTYLGGSNANVAFDIAVDSSGSVYVTGRTTSNNFPTADPFQAFIRRGGSDVFVTKFNATGSALVYSTYLGGNISDTGHGIVVNSSGNAYVTGITQSTDFPTVNPFQASKDRSEDVFVTKLNTTGSALVYSTYLGGNGSDIGNGIAIDSAGNAYVTGLTLSTDFPTASPFQDACFSCGFSVSRSDAFVTKFNTTGSALVYSTYLGGARNDDSRSIAVDSFGNAYVTGFTSSTNFPTANPIQRSRSGGEDAFVTKLNTTGSALVYSTYLGGSLNDVGHGIAVDAVGAAYVTGQTGSTNFPTANPFQSFRGGFFDAFVTKLNTTGSALVYSTYLGGGGRDRAFGIAVNDLGNAHVTGLTSSGNFPIEDSIQATSGGGFDVFVTKMNVTGNALVFSTYLGGSGLENGLGIAVDTASNVYVTGFTLSTDFPTANPFQASKASRVGAEDAFVVKLGVNQPPIADAGVDQTIFVGEIIQLNGSGSSDPDNDPLTFTWEFIVKPAGSVAVLSDPSLINPTSIADVAGDYIIQLTVNDGTVDSDSDQVTITALTLQEATQEVVEEVEDLINLEIVNKGQGDSLIVKLEAAIKQLGRENTNAATKQFQAFIKEVNALIKGGILSQVEGELLIDVVNTISEQLSD